MKPFEDEGSINQIN